MEISSERVDDIPLIVEMLKQMKIAKWIDQQLKQPHGNHQGLSYGQLSVILLIYIISQSDHRLSAAEAWVNSHRKTLELSTGWSIGAKDVTDDRLARVVEEFGKQAEACQKIEQKLGQHLIRAYELPTEVGRVDPTSYSVHHEQIESETDSLLRYGHSKDQRPDLLQYRRLPRQQEEEPAVGIGFEVELGKFWLNPETSKWVTWHERYLVAYSHIFATAQIRGLHERIEKAKASLELLAQKPGNDLELLNTKVAAILKHHRVNQLLLVTTAAQTITHTRYINKGRPTAHSPMTQATEIQLQLQSACQPNAIKEAEQLAGWRLYVTNAPVERLSLNAAIVYYRDQWIVERGFHRFKRGQLPALPIYFQNQDRIVGLMFLLTLALRLFTLMEFVVRLALATAQEKLSGLYDGNPLRATERPSAEQLLKAFDNITLYLLPDTSLFVTTLSALHRQILSLLKLPESI